MSETKIIRPLRRRWLVASIVGATVAGTMAALFATSPAANAAVPAPPAGWSTVFSDDFNGAAGSPVDGQWVHDTGTGTFGTGEIETMTTSTANTHLDGNGDLQITALGSGNSWTSGRLHTPNPIASAPAGGELEVTASIQQPNGGLGYWPAFWMLGQGQWPENGEIDIMEDVNTLSDVAGTIHCGVFPGGPCNEGNGIGSGLRGCGGCQGGFHTYTMIEDRRNTSNESINFLLDGNQYFSVSEAQVGAATWQQGFDHGLMIMLDLAIGGGFPNGVCGCTTPQGSTASGGTMTLQYVAAYTTTSGNPPPPPPPPGGGSQIVGFGGKCVDVAGANPADGTQVQLFTCNGTAAQSWTHSGNTYQALGKCLDVAGAGTANGTKVQLFTCNGTGAQSWTHTASNQLVNTNSGKCLDATGVSSADGTPLQIWACSGGANQVWNGP